VSWPYAVRAAKTSPAAEANSQPLPSESADQLVVTNDFCDALDG